MAEAPSKKATETSKAVPTPPLSFPLRFESAEVRNVVERVSKEEDVSLNDAINLIIKRWNRTPRSWRELGSLVTYLQHEIAIIQAMMEESLKNEADLLRELESDRLPGTDLEEARNVAAKNAGAKTAGVNTSGA